MCDSHCVFQNHLAANLVKFGLVKLLVTWQLVCINCSGSIL